MSGAARGRALPAAMLAVALAAASAANADAQQRTFDCDLPDRKTVSRVVGGSSVGHEQFPWQVSIGSTMQRHPSLPPPRNAFERHFCGGSLIGARWVLTAAHCLVETFPVKTLRVVHGTTDLRRAGGAATRAVEAAYVHPGYSGNAARGGNDIALLRLSEPIPNASKSYAKLPVERFASQRSFSGACSVVTGWGTTQQGLSESAPPLLQAAGLPLVSAGNCRAAYPGAKISEGEICAGLPEGGRDSCQGDSGGPLVVEGLGEGQHMLVGVVSWGEGCAQAGKYGVYARVSHYMPWIVRTIRGQ